MDTNKIREALERIATMDEDPRFGHTSSDVLLRLVMVHAKEVLAEPDAAPKALTDEEIERYAENHSIWHRGKEPSPDGKRDGCAPESIEEAFIVGAIWYRDNGYLAPAAGLTMDGPLYDFKPDGTDVRLSVYPDHNHDGGFYLSWLQGEERWSTKLGWADVMECLANEYAPDDVAMRLQDQMKSARLTAAIQAKR